MFVNDLFKLIENSNEEYYAVFNQRGRPMIMRKPVGKTAEDYAEEKNLTIKGGPFNSHQETESFWIRNVLPTKKEQGVSEDSSIDDRIKGRIQNIVRELSDIPGYWDWQRDTFTPYGVEALASTLKNNKQYIKYALSLTSDDYYADDLKEQGVDENSLNEFLDDRNKDDDDGGDGRGRKSPKARARAQVLKMYGDGDITFRKTSNGGYFIQHEDDFGDTNSHQYDPQTGRVDFSGGTSSSYYGEGVAEGADNITAVFSGYGNYMSGRGANVFKHYGITVLDKQYFEDEDIAEYTVSGSKEALDQARAYLERSDQFGGMIIKQGVAEGGFDIPEIPRAPQPRPEPKNKSVGEGSVQDKLYRRQQELRKKRGAPDPEYYRELRATYDLPDEERYAKAAELKKKYQVTNEDVERYLDEIRRAGYDIVTEAATLCPECGGAAYEDRMLAEKQDACYHKVKSRYKVWPSAYASGALVRCRKKGAKNWGNKSK
jgi:hypothetical protein